MLKKIASLILVTLLAACSDSADEQVKSDIDNTTTETILASVNGQSISDEDLDAAIIRTVGELAAFQLDQKGRDKVLQSLVLSKAMAITQMSQLDSDNKKQIERMVTAYREELLAKRYLRDNISAVPVTEKMVKDYYDKHPEKFGGKTIKTFEVVKGTTKLTGIARDKMIEAMNQLVNEENWQQKVEQLKAQNLQVSFSQGAVTQGVLNSNIDPIISSLNLQETSSLHFIKGLPMIFRVVKENKIQPKALTEVRATIRKSLAPIQLKKAVKRASDELLKQVNVKYFNVTAN